ncbi:hypothetical protein PROFUN_04810 [Planoprotostelium fungivorum]|uniref:AAA+ ATPase domain-containing protein n=1 Tax=Planoprotostelium fungivorum TaxID=1890364 RepID=A0A2P6NSZ0_9EUKA|nr:hypothetical protein PROFUN_04810 [Planoprotostelium fungivorum]
MVFAFCIHSLQQLESHPSTVKLYLTHQFSDLNSGRHKQSSDSDANRPPSVWLSSVAAQVQRDYKWRTSYHQDIPPLDRLIRETRSNDDPRMNQQRTRKRATDLLEEGTFAYDASCNTDQDQLEALLREGEYDEEQEKKIVVWKQVSPDVAFTLVCHSAENILVARRALQSITKVLRDRYKKIDVLSKVSDLQSKVDEIAVVVQNLLPNGTLLFMNSSQSKYIMKDVDDDTYYNHIKRALMPSHRVGHQMIQFLVLTVATNFASESLETQQLVNASSWTITQPNYYRDYTVQTSHSHDHPQRLSMFVSHLKRKIYSDAMPVKQVPKIEEKSSAPVPYEADMALTGLYRAMRPIGGRRSSISLHPPNQSGGGYSTITSLTPTSEVVEPSPVKDPAKILPGISPPTRPASAVRPSSAVSNVLINPLMLPTSRPNPSSTTSVVASTTSPKVSVQKVPAHMATTPSPRFKPQSTIEFDSVVEAISRLLSKRWERPEDFIRTVQSSKSFDFIYLKIKDSKMTNKCVYDVEVIAPTQVDYNDYLTLSVEGISRFTKNTMFFIPLREWVMEKNVYDQIIYLDFFRNFRRRKTFQIWRKMIARKYHRYKLTLRADIFHIQDAMHKGIFQCRQICLEMEDEQYTVYQSSEWLAKQDHRRAHTLQKSIAKLTQIVASCCQIVVDINGGSFRSLGNYEEEKEERSLRRMKYFVRLVQYMLTSSLTIIITKSTILLSHMVAGKPPSVVPLISQPRNVRKSPMWQSDLSTNTDPLASIQHRVVFPANIYQWPFLIVSLGVGRSAQMEGKIIIKPNLKRLLAVFQDVCDTFPTTLDTLPQLDHNKQIALYIQNFSTPAERYSFTVLSGSLQQIVSQDEKQKGNILNLKSMVTACYAKVEEHTMELSPLLKMREEKIGNAEYSDVRLTSTDLTKYQLNGQTEGLPVQEYRQVIENSLKQIEEIHRLGEQLFIGCFSVDRSTLKNQLLPIPTASLHGMYNLIPNIANDMSRCLLERINDRVNTLRTPPISLDTCARWIAVLHEVENTTDEIQERHQYIIDVYQLMEEFKMQEKGNQIELPSIEHINESVTALLAVTEVSKDRKSDNIQSHTKELSQILIEDERRTRMVAEMLDDTLLDDIETPVDVVIEKLDQAKDVIDKLREDREAHHDYELLLEMRPLTEMTNLTQVEEVYGSTKKMWEINEAWREFHGRVTTTTIDQIDVDDVSREVQNYTSQVREASKVLVSNRIVAHLRDSMEKVKIVIPLLQDLQNESLKPRHWDDIYNSCGSFPTNRHLTVQKIYQMNLFRFKKEINDVSSTATQENSLETNFAKIRHQWESREMEFQAHKKGEEALILVNVDDLLNEIEDDTVTLATMTASRYSASVAALLKNWQVKLEEVAAMTSSWMNVQRSWIGLEKIFSAADIQRQIPTETKMFNEVDKTFRKLMQQAAIYPKVLAVTLKYGTKEALQQCSVILENVQKGVDVYLETKRDAFPRFYFVSDDELLDILSHIRDHEYIQMYLIKCFEGISRLDLYSDSRNTLIKGMISQEGEKVELCTQLKIRGAIEDWLGALEVTMKKTIHDNLASAHLLHEGHGIQYWIFSEPAMVVMTILQAYWCRSVTRALQTKGDCVSSLRAILSSLEQDLVVLARLVQQPSEWPEHIQSYGRTLIGSLIVIVVHQRDTVESLITERCDSVDHFEWMRQMRYYVDGSSGDVIIRQAMSSFVHGCEYLGCTSRLVITPLTTRTFITLTGALTLNLGGAPEGPAGTGKTETCKDLSKALGKQCLVFNCSEGLDYRMMGKLFSGLVQTGAFACFDEFNRIEVEVLSVIAQQLLTIQTAILYGSTIFSFEGRDLKLNSNCGFFITMNPGYAGRSELPDNLKAMFRPVAMTVPEISFICEIMLFSQGFVESKNLASKLVNAYRLCSEQLSPQIHYDWGLRSIRSVLNYAGALKRDNPEKEEHLLLIQALTASNAPKFLPDDLPLFYGIMQDLFPEVRIGTSLDDVLHRAIGDVLPLHHLASVQYQIDKMKQLYEMIGMRHGIMLVGPAGCGKTTVYKILAEAIPRTRSSVEKVSFLVFKPQSLQVHTHVINPKSISIGQLYGAVDPRTQEWRDGAVTSLVRGIMAQNAVGHNKERNLHWILFDGPVDAHWIENMNSVLDDNKLLCLANGERIIMPSNITMIFEVDHLNEASPATVSRCGMVYIEPDRIDWKDVVHLCQSKMQHEPKGYHLCNVNIPLLSRLYLNVVDKVLQLLTERLSSVRIQLQRTELVQSHNHMLQALFRRHNIHCKEVHEDGTPCELSTLVSVCFLFSTMWSFGAIVDRSIWTEIDALLKNIFADKIELPSEGSLFDHYLTTTQPPRLAHYNEIIPREYTFDPNVQVLDELLLPDIDTYRYREVLTLLCTHGNRPVVVSGPSGCGKTVLVSQVVEKSPKTMSRIFHCSRSTDCPIIRSMVQDSMDRKRTRTPGKVQYVLTTKGDGRTVFFIDDLHRAGGGHTPEGGSAAELLRQWIDMEAFFDGKSLEWNATENTKLIVSISSSDDDSENLISPRVLRHFHRICMPQISTEQQIRICQGMVRSSVLQNNLPRDSKSFLENIVHSSISVYNRVVRQFRPTPGRPFHLFATRDLIRSIKSLFFSNVSKEVQSHDVLLRLWYHEICRIYGDRLSSEEQTRLDQIVLEAMRDHLNVTWRMEQLHSSKSFFGDFLSMGGYAPDRPYDETPELNQGGHLYQELWKKYETAYQTTGGGTTNIVFFKEAVLNISAICRAIRQQRGHLLLVGLGGMGKRTLSRFSTFVCGYEISEISIFEGYNLANFRDDIKKLYRQCGTMGRPTVLLINDNQMIHDSFLEYVEFLVRGWFIPDLFLPEELEPILQNISTQLKANQPETKSANGESVEVNIPRSVLMSTLLERVYTNLHLIFCLSPVSDIAVRQIFRHSAIISCSTVRFFEEWPSQALRSVGEHLVAQSPIDWDMKSTVVDLCEKIHRGVVVTSNTFTSETGRHNYVTPSHYLQLYRSFFYLLDKKRGESMDSRNKLSMGLKTLEETQSAVGDLQIQLNALKPVLQKSAEETQELMGRISIEQKDVDEAKRVIIVEEAEISEQTAEIQAIKEAAERDLVEALPALESAVRALNTLNKNDIAEMKTFSSPPAGVLLVMEAVAIIRQVPANWASAKMLLSEPNFLQSLIDYDKDNIPPKIVAQLKKYILNPMFVVSKIEKVSFAAKSLCQWIHSLIHYSEVNEIVAPKKAKLAKSSAKLSESLVVLHKKQEQLERVIRKLEELQAVYVEKEGEKNSLSKQMEDTALKLSRAEKLMNGLALERVQWAEQLRSLQVESESLLSCVLLSAAFSTYLGVFNGKTRRSLLSDWCSMCIQAGLIMRYTETFQYVLFMSHPIEVYEWITSGLPSDQQSLQNAVMASTGQKWPLIIDPEGEATRWILEVYREIKLKPISIFSNTLVQQLQRAIQEGTPVVVDVSTESLPPVLEPILARNVYSKGGQDTILFGGIELLYNHNFKLYMVTKQHNPRYLPEIYILTNVINFVATSAGLEEQLLAEVVKNEAPELEHSREKLVTDIAADKKQLKLISDKILELIGGSTDNLLENEDLINTLSESEQTTKIVTRRLKEAEQTEVSTNEARAVYNSVAVRGSILYFVINSLNRLDSMYQYSLASFKKGFNSVFSMPAEVTDKRERLVYLIQEITKEMYRRTCVGLFEEHRLLFSASLSFSIDRRNSDVTEDNWNVLLRGHPEFLRGTWYNHLDHQKFSEMIREPAEILEKEAKIEGLCKDMMDNVNEWMNWMTSETPENQIRPTVYARQLHAFHVLLIMRAYRMDRVHAAATDYVRSSLGNVFIESVPLDLMKIYRSSDQRGPIFFILSSGADPTGLVTQLAATEGFTERMDVCSLGKGQGDRAVVMIREAMSSGRWVMLQNCHLAQSWLPELEKIVKGMNDSSVQIHPNYRLWLTCMPTAKFPVSVLQASIKLTNEPPRGVKANLKRSMMQMSSHFSKEKSYEWRRLLFSLCYFHAVVQERRKFGPIGWNVPYGFNESDLHVSSRVLGLHLTEENLNSGISFSSLLYIIGEVNYGGKVTDPWDRRLLLSILHRFCNPNALEPIYRFYNSPAYCIPKESNDPVTSYNTYIDQLPSVDGVELFGLDYNSNITLNLKESNLLIEAAQKLEHREGSEKDRSSVAGVLLPFIVDTLKILGNLISLPDASSQHPMDVVLRQEIVRFNHLHHLITASLHDLRLSLDGEITENGDIREVKTSLLLDRVPRRWGQLYPSIRSLRIWLRDLVERLRFFREWAGGQLPDVYWISAFSSPQALLTAVLQVYARKTSKPIDHLAMRYHVMKDETSEPPTDGALIRGVYVTGAAWNKDKHCLEDSPRGQLFSPMPYIWMEPYDVKEKKKESKYVCPLYITSTRAGKLSTSGSSSNCITSIPLPMSPHLESDQADANHWTCRGVALLCQPE